MVKRTNKLVLAGALTFLAITSVCAFYMQRPKRGNRIDERWEASNRSFKIRVTAYAEDNGGFVAGAYYLFESAPIGSTNWREVMTFRHDDPIPIPRDQVRFLGDQIGYVFMGWKYAVTTNAGKDWSVWTAERDLPNWQCCNYRLIRNVTMAGDGKGIMQLNPIQDRRGEIPELRTNDYGRHWRAD